MQRGKFWAAGFAVVIAAGVAFDQATSVSPVDAGTGSGGGSTCSSDTLSGRYLLTSHGSQNPGTADEVAYAAAGYTVYKRDGGMRSVVSVSRQGTPARTMRFSGHYSVRGDCSGDVTYGTGERFNLFTTPRGDILTLVQVSPGGVRTSVEMREGTGGEASGRRP